MPYVYKITNNINGNSYVGYTKRADVNQRIDEHFFKSVYESIDRPLYKAIRKYGKNNFTYDILFESPDEHITLKKEIEYIKIYGDYNLHEGGNVPPNQTGKTWSLTEETKNKMRKPKAPRTKEHAEKLSNALKGKSPWNKGKKGSQVSWCKGKRTSSRTMKWKITRDSGEIIIDNLVYWCEQNGYITSTVKNHYYQNRFPYKDILIIEKVK